MSANIVAGTEGAPLDAKVQDAFAASHPVNDALTGLDCDLLAGLGWVTNPQDRQISCLLAITDGICLLGFASGLSRFKIS